MQVIEVTDVASKPKEEEKIILKSDILEPEKTVEEKIIKEEDNIPKEKSEEKKEEKIETIVVDESIPQEIKSEEKIEEKPKEDTKETPDKIVTEENKIEISKTTSNIDEPQKENI